MAVLPSLGHLSGGFPARPERVPIPGGIVVAMTEWSDYYNGMRISIAVPCLELRLIASLELNHNWFATYGVTDYQLVEIITIEMNRVVAPLVDAGRRLNIPPQSLRDMLHGMRNGLQELMQRVVVRCEDMQRHRAGERLGSDLYRDARSRRRPSQDFFDEESKVASARARDLLRSHLTPAQREAFDKSGEFSVIAKTGVTYRITSARSFNVVAPDGTTYCGQTPGTPIADQMLAQKLLLEQDPEQFFKHANKSPGHRTAIEVETRRRVAEDAFRWVMTNTTAV